MKRETLYKAIDAIDDEIIYRNGKVERIGAAKIRNRKKIFRLVASIVAVVILFIGIDLYRSIDVFLPQKDVEDSSIIDTSNDETYISSVQNTSNMFVITAKAMELDADAGDSTISSGDVMGLRDVSALYGSSAYLTQRFTISGENIKKVEVITDKCYIYSSVPVYEGDPDFERAISGETKDNEEYEMIADVDFDYDEDNATEPTPYHYDHIVIEGNTYDGIYNSEMSFGMSVPEELWSSNEDMQKSFHEDVDQVNGAILTISVTYMDETVEEHHYKISTGKIFVPTNEDGFCQWDNLTRFLTAEEEAAGEAYTYGYLMEKID